MNIRVASKTDLPEMGRVRMSVKENRIPDLTVLKPEDIDRVFGVGRSWVCDVDDRIVAFAMADLAKANVYALFVEPGCEGRGIGRRLHDTMLDWMFEAGAPKVWLSTDPNTRAESVYRRAGWTDEGRVAKGEIRFTMSRERWRRSR